MNSETKRLLIRPLTLADLDELALLFADSEVMRFSKNGPLTKEQTEKLLKTRILDHYEMYGFGIWALIHKKDNSFIGIAGLISQQIDGQTHIELAYRIFPAYWGMGLAFEATHAILEKAHPEFGLKNLIALIEPENIRSVALAKRLGFHVWKEYLFHEKIVQIHTRDCP